MESKLIITNGWHPTLNASSRMPIHHLRYAELLGSGYIGVLNQLPRRYGGSTIRLMRIRDGGRIRIVPIAVGQEWMPWWISGNSSRAINVMSSIFENASKHKYCDLCQKKQYSKYLKQYLKYMDIYPEYTMGEIVHKVNNYLYKEIFNGLPDIDLISLKKHALLQDLSNAFNIVCGDLGALLSYVSIGTHSELNCSLGIVKDYYGREYYVEFISGENTFCGKELSDPLNIIKIDVNDLRVLFSEGVFEPSLDLLVILELVLMSNGYELTHYGNCIEKFEKYSKVMKVDYLSKLRYWEDEQESWNFARICSSNNTDYPLHLLDLMAIKDRGFKHCSDYIEQSIAKKRTIDIILGQGEEIEKYLNDPMSRF